MSPSLFQRIGNTFLANPLLSRAEVAQLAEHSPEKAGVGSSILPLGTNISNKFASLLDLT